VVSIDLDVDAIVSGEKVQRWDTIGGKGDHADAEWIVRAPDGGGVTVEVRSAVFGDQVVEVPLGEAE
jgi:hypothetical protein